MKAEDKIWVLSELIAVHYLTLDLGMATGCKCMHCPVYVLKEDGCRVCEAETLGELIEEAAKLYKIGV